MGVPYPQGQLPTQVLRVVAEHGPGVRRRRWCAVQLRPGHHVAGTAGSVTAWGAHVCAQVCVPVAHVGIFARVSAHVYMPVVWVHCGCA